MAFELTIDLEEAARVAAWLGDQCAEKGIVRCSVKVGDAEIQVEQPPRFPLLPDPPLSRQEEDLERQGLLAKLEQLGKPTEF